MHAARCAAGGQNRCCCPGLRRGSGADTIDFSVTGTIALARTPLIIDSNGHDKRPGSREPHAGAIEHRDSALYVGNGCSVTISGDDASTATERRRASGAGIYHYGVGTLTVQNSVFSGNVSPSDGGAIYNYSGNFVIQSSTFSGNRAAPRWRHLHVFRRTHDPVEHLQRQRGYRQWRRDLPVPVGGADNDRFDPFRQPSRSRAGQSTSIPLRLRRSPTARSRATPPVRGAVRIYLYDQTLTSTTAR